LLTIRAIAVRNIRNIRAIDLEPGPGLNVLSGDNGQGKTNIIESIYLAATSRSFRTPNLKEVVARGEREGSVRMTVSDYVQTVGVRGGLRQLRIGEKQPDSIGEYAAKTPVVAFSPTEIVLSMGPGKERRKLLDRIALYTSPAAAEQAMRYTRALKNRQRALEGRGAKASDLDAWEELVVRHGLETMRSRRDSSERLASAARAVFAQIGATSLVLEAVYVPSAPEDALAYASLLRATREIDARRKSAASGPHRDDLVLTLGGTPVRGYASQGQHRAIVLALKAAELSIVAESRRLRPVLLLDDVSSELDRARGTALMTFLDKQQGQVFVTTTRPELIETTPTGRMDFWVKAGQIGPM
jgi:DNA replication and repair protein RecF